MDLIDGTTSYASGIPLNAPSGAVARDGELIVGVVLDPHRSEVLLAVNKGHADFLNCQPFPTSDSGNKAESIGNAVSGIRYMANYWLVVFMDSCSRVSLIEDKLPLDLVHLGLLWSS